MRARLAKLLCLAALCGGIAAVPPPAGAVGPDTMKASAPLASIGRLNMAGHRFRKHCTATLVAPDLALTAQHCLRQFLSEAAAQPEDLHLLLGYDRGSWVEHRRIEAFLFPDADSASVDVAYLRLTEPSVVQPLAIRPEPPTVGENLIQVGYAADRPHIASVEPDCVVLQPLPKGAWLHSCDPEPGTSGGPLLVMEEGGYRVAAINIGRSPHGGVATNVPPPDLRQ